MDSPPPQRQAPLPALDQLAAAAARGPEPELEPGPPPAPGSAPGHAQHDPEPDPEPDPDREAAAAAALFLARAFRAGVPLRPALDAAATRHGTRAWDSVAAQDAVLRHTLGLVAALRAPPFGLAGFSYGRARAARFTRLLLAEVEEARAPLSETLALAAAEACAAVPAAATTTTTTTPGCVDDGVAMCHVTFATPRSVDGDIVPDIVLRVAQHFSCLGRRVWTAGLALHCLAGDRGSPVGAALHALRTAPRGRRGVLELGAGTGVCAGALARAAGAGGRVVLTDVGDVVDNLAYNARLNAGRGGMVGVTEAMVSVETLDMMDVDEVVARACDWEVGVAVAADLTYDESLVDGIVRAMAALARRADVVSFLLATSRSVETDVRLADALRGCGAMVRAHKYELAAGAFDYLVDADFEAVRLYEIRV